MGPVAGECVMLLRTRGLEVDVVTRQGLPLAKVLGDELGARMQRLHESHGGRFHCGADPVALDDHGVTLGDGPRTRPSR